MFNPEDRPVTSWAAIAVAGGLTAYGLHGAMKEGLGDVFKLSFSNKFKNTAGKVAGSIKPDSVAAGIVARNNLVRRQVAMQQGFERAGQRTIRRFDSFSKKRTTFMKKLGEITELAGTDALAKKQMEGLLEPIRSYWTNPTFNSKISADPFKAMEEIYDLALKGKHRGVGKVWDAVQNIHKFFKVKGGRFLEESAPTAIWQKVSMGPEEILTQLGNAGYIADFDTLQMNQLKERGMHILERVENGTAVPNSRFLAFTKVGDRALDETPFKMHLPMDDAGNLIGLTPGKGMLIQHPTGKLAYGAAGLIDIQGGQITRKAFQTKILEMVGSGASVDDINAASEYMMDYLGTNFDIMGKAMGEDRRRLVEGQVVIESMIGKDAREVLRDPVEGPVLREKLRKLGVDENIFAKKPGPTMRLLSYKQGDFGGVDIGQGVTALEDLMTEVSVLKDQPHHIRSLSKMDLWSVSKTNKQLYQAFEAHSAVLPSQVTQALYDSMGGLTELSTLAMQHKGDLRGLARQLLDKSQLDKMFDGKRGLAKEAVQKLIAGAGNEQRLVKLLARAKNDKFINILQDFSNLNIGQGFIDYGTITDNVKEFVSGTHLGHEPMNAPATLKGKDIIYDDVARWGDAGFEPTKFSKKELVGILDSGRATRLSSEFDYYTLQKVAVPDVTGKYHITALGHMKSGSRRASYVLTQGQNRGLYRAIKIEKALRSVGQFFGLTGQKAEAGIIRSLLDVNELGPIQALTPEEMMRDMTRSTQNRMTLTKSGIYHGSVTLSATRLGGTRAGNKVKMMTDHFQLLGDMLEGETGDRFITELASKVSNYDPTMAAIVDQLHDSLSSGADTFGEKAAYSISTEVTGSKDFYDRSKYGMLDPVRSEGAKYRSLFASKGEEFNAVLQKAAMPELPQSMGRGDWYYSISALNESILGGGKGTKAARALSTRSEALLGKIAAGEEAISSAIGSLKESMAAGANEKIINTYKEQVRKAILAHKETLKEYYQSAGYTGKGGIGRGNNYFKDSTRLSVQSSKSRIGETTYDWIGEVGDEGLERMGVKIRGKGKLVEATGETIWDAKNAGELVRVDREGRIYLRGADQKAEVLATAFASRQPNTWAGMLDLRYNRNLKGFHVATNFSPDQLLMLDRDNDMLDMVLMKSAVDPGGKLSKGANFTSAELQAIFKQQSAYLEKAATFAAPFRFKDTVKYEKEFGNLGIMGADEYKMYDDFLGGFLQQDAKFKEVVDKGLAKELATKGSEFQSSYEELVKKGYFKGGDKAQEELSKIYSIRTMRRLGNDKQGEALYRSFHGSFVTRDTNLERKFKENLPGLLQDAQAEAALRGEALPADIKDVLKKRFIAAEMESWTTRSIMGEQAISRFTQMKRTLRAYSMIGGINEMGEDAKMAEQILGSVFQQVPIKEMKHGSIEAVQAFDAITQGLSDSFAQRDIGAIKKTLGGMSLFKGAAEIDQDAAWLAKRAVLEAGTDVGTAYVEHKFQPVFQSIEKTMAREDFPELSRIVATMNRRMKDINASSSDIAKFLVGQGYNIPKFKPDGVLEGIMRKGTDIAEAMGKSRGVAFAMLAGFGALSLAGALMGGPSGKPLIGKRQLDEQAIAEGLEGQSAADAHSLQNQEPPPSFMNRLGMQQNVGQTVQSRGMISHDQSPAALAGAFRGSTGGNVNMRIYGNHDSRLSLRTRRRIREQQ